MSKVQASVIIPTYNRHHKLADTVALLAAQTVNSDEYEIIVVDDGSTPSVELAKANGGPTIRIERTEGVERSAARNRGAAIANGEVLIFVDDDISVGCDFVEAHRRAHSDWPGALAVGAVNLPDQEMNRPFPRFRQELERRGVPATRGITSRQSFCTAQNMSVARDLFQRLGGFEASMVSSEDQDFALRHAASGGKIVFLPEALAVHRDEAFDIRSYCRRAEWGSLHLIPFCRRYPTLQDNLERERINGYVAIGREYVWLSLKKGIKRILGTKQIVALLFLMTLTLERFASESATLKRLYTLLLGIHIFRGHRKGLRTFVATDQSPAASAQGSRSSSVATLRADG